MFINGGGYERQRHGFAVESTDDYNYISVDAVSCAGHYEGNDERCYMCDWRCETCFGPNSNNCLSCHHSKLVHRKFLYVASVGLSQWKRTNLGFKAPFN